MSSAGPLIARLQGICGAEHVHTDAEALLAYQSDALSRHHQRPLAVVAPGSARQVRAAVRACYEEGVPWVARGAGTGLSGGALPVAEGILIVLARMRRVLRVDLPNARVTVEPGVTNLAISHAVAPTHFYPPDPASQIVCSIGGNIAENSAGAHCFKYGLTANYVSALDVVLPDGQQVRLEREMPGYDLLGAFIGSEGTLGVATAIELRVLPAPESVRTLVAFFEEAAAAGEAVSQILAAGIVPAALEMMDRLAVSAAERATGAGYRLDAGAALLIELDGPDEECLAGLEETVALCRREGAREVRIALDADERALLWEARRAAFAAMGHITPAYIVQDAVIPRTRLAQVLARIEQLSRNYGLPVANVLHAGDGNLHPLVCYDPAVAGQARRAEELAGEIVRACLALEGSITGEHGVGVDKKAYMPAMFSAADLDAFDRLRCAFDPAGLANPGKVMPAPRLCGGVPGPYRERPLERQGVTTRS
jgi:glycolate oxidase